MSGNPSDPRARLRPWIPDCFVVSDGQIQRGPVPMSHLAVGSRLHLAINVAFWAIHRAKLRGQQ